jgi:hypothetical protein
MAEYIQSVAIEDEDIPNGYALRVSIFRRASSEADWGLVHVFVHRYLDESSPTSVRDHIAKRVQSFVDLDSSNLENASREERLKGLVEGLSGQIITPTKKG